MLHTHLIKDVRLVVNTDSIENDVILLLMLALLEECGQVFEITAWNLVRDVLNFDLRDVRNLEHGDILHHLPMPFLLQIDFQRVQLLSVVLEEGVSDFDKESVGNLPRSAVSVSVKLFNYLLNAILRPVNGFEEHWDTL